MFKKKEVVRKTKTHILCSVTFFRKLGCLWDKMEKWQYNTTHALRMLDS